MPAYYGLNHHRDKEGRINIVAATEELNREREIKRKSKSGRQALDNLIQYHPLVPSEIFLSREGNIFPVFELKERLNKVEQLNAQALLEKKVTLSFDSSQPSGINYKIDISNKLTAVNDYP
jgi:hypothetical protein